MTIKLRSSQRPSYPSYRRVVNVSDLGGISRPMFSLWLRGLFNLFFFVWTGDSLLLILGNSCRISEYTDNLLRLSE